MSTSQTITLSKPTGDQKIYAGALTYMRARLRQRIHSMILKEFQDSGLTQAQLARRLGKNDRVVYRWIATPENMRLNTLSDLIFAICGGEPSNQVESPLDSAASNQTLPGWLAESLDAQRVEQKTLSETSSTSRQFRVVPPPQNDAL